mmetsp:Transcript_15240/g.20702  ORF Transcript_15240/g.20702 Transcript_15240/m.20702 type:complete len:265 (-) Transcript_15240:538-1332(-)|eukprot:CAMPEP_0185569038 /NCGR_PEP_ID=MMETSP0434-20130131/1789_1 /TAXON_ID=626734 ORGANISM="Favella taraikaensis, Strain Fe Narragansett Bay" /NCGR_SAMPLE_ID=MMETSP0434 /ASSEMBLY_ACC=CAM_ASM_000379 /LENGTH=264 /DNA_ID=CAMNT_0028183699 /DNA_START=1940 /DNA_END=2734 /DNA_ORIENTATION=-
MVFRAAPLGDRVLSLSILTIDFVLEGGAPCWLLAATLVAHVLSRLSFILVLAEGLAGRRHRSLLLRLTTSTTTSGLKADLGRVSALDSLTVARRLALERGSIEVLRVLWQVLEADKVGVLGADGLRIDENVFLRVHKLLKRLQVEWAAHADEELGVLHVGIELVEDVWLRAVRKVQVVELLHVLETLAIGPLRFDNLCGDHARDDSEHGDNGFDLAVAVCNEIILVAHEEEKARRFDVLPLLHEEQAEKNNFVEIVLLHGVARV